MNKFLKIALLLFLMVNVYSVSAQKDTICIYQSVTGRIIDENGQGISVDLQVTSIDEVDPVSLRNVRSNQFGYYEIPNLVSCGNYGIRPSKQKYYFTPFYQTVIPSKRSTNIDFFGITRKD